MKLDQLRAYDLTGCAQGCQGCLDDDKRRADEETRPVSESEVVGLAIQLLKQRGAVEVTGGRLIAGAFDARREDRYLVVPLEALEDNE